MRTRTIILCALLASLAGASASLAAQSAPRRCSATFTGEVHRGPDAGVSLVGKLRVKIAPTGPLRGSLTHHENRVPVTGSLHRRALTLSFHLPGGLRITGVGVARRSVTTCSSLPTGGALRGPRHHDRGTWGVVWGT
jgi:hypothetical protein